MKTTMPESVVSDRNQQRKSFINLVLSFLPVHFVTFSHLSNSTTTMAAAPASQPEDVVITHNMPDNHSDMGFTASQQMQLQPVSQAATGQLMVMQPQQQPVMNVDNNQALVLSQLTNMDHQAMLMLVATAQQILSQQQPQQLIAMNPMSQSFTIPNMMVNGGMMNMPTMNSGQFPSFTHFPPEVQQQLQFQQQLQLQQQQHLQQFQQQQQQQSTPPIPPFSQLLHHSSVSTLEEDTPTPSPPQSRRSSERLTSSTRLGQKRPSGLAEAITSASSHPNPPSQSPEQEQQQQRQKPAKRRRKSRASDETLVDGQSSQSEPPLPPPSSSISSSLSFSTVQQPPTPTLTPTPPPPSQPKGKPQYSRNSSTTSGGSAGAASGPIFVQKDGRPLRFLVQVNMSIRQKRKLLTNEITVSLFFRSFYF
jgi:hypothetical protein